MLVRYTAIYALGRGLPGVLNLAAIALYTRLLSPPDYGRYTLVLAGVAVCNAVAFYWLRVSAVRQLPADPTSRPPFIGALYSMHLRVGLVIVALGLAAAAASAPDLRVLILVGLVVLLTQAWFELNLDVNLASLNPGRYAILAIVRAALAVLVGGLLAYWGYGPLGVLVGSLTAFLVSALPSSFAYWRTALVIRPDPLVIRKIVGFGLPLAGAYSVGVISSGVDRFLLGWLSGTQSVGQYAAASDLALQTVTALMMIVSLSALPLAVRAHETAGATASAAQLARHGVVLVAVALPATAGIAILAPQIAAAFLGPSFREAASGLIPLIAIGSLFGGLKAFYFDVAFQLADATKGLLNVTMLSAGLSVTLNLVLIPRLGASGAAYAMVATFAATCALSAVIGRRAFRVPFPVVEWAKIFVAAGVMMLVLVPFRGSAGGIATLASTVSVGFLVYVVAAVALNVGGCRQALWARLRAGADRR